jgi:hypothetical protein
MGAASCKSSWLIVVIGMVIGGGHAHAACVARPTILRKQVAVANERLVTLEPEQREVRKTIAALVAQLKRATEPEKHYDGEEDDLDHVGRAATHLHNFHPDGATSKGVLRNPKIQATALKMARVELEKAIAIIERTKW